MTIRQCPAPNCALQKMKVHPEICMKTKDADGMAAVTVVLAGPQSGILHKTPRPSAHGRPPLPAERLLRFPGARKGGGTATLAVQGPVAERCGAPLGAEVNSPLRIRPVPSTILEPANISAPTVPAGRWRYAHLAAAPGAGCARTVTTNCLTSTATYCPPTATSLNLRSY